MVDEGSADKAETAKPGDDSPPALASLFLIKFDLKVGYTIAWKRSIDDVPLEGVVEFKSLPSGLHNVKEDLVYFVHEQYAGLSAFANASAGVEERNARFVAVGLLLPLKDGRLGRAWLHAADLKKLARQLVADSDDIAPLEEFWEKNRIHDVVNGRPAAADSPFTAAQRRVRTLSTTTLVSPSERSLPPYHPAFSIFELLDTFGPLVYPLHREALLRRRLLLVTRPPVHLPCDFVYDLSILASLPLSLSSVVTLPSSSLFRIRPLFALGIHDIPYLENLHAPSTSKTTNGHPILSSSESSAAQSIEGWIACTTDEILTVKSHLYDVLVEMPSVHGNKWPNIKRATDGKPIKATQRDLRRYRALRRALNPIRRLIHQGGDTEQRFDDQESDEHSHLLFKQPRADAYEEDDGWTNGDEDKLTEPTSWSALAYSSFIWWASAGERDDTQIEEEQLDQDLLADIGMLAAKVADSFRYTDEPSSSNAESAEDSPTDRSSPAHAGRDHIENNALLETAVIAYFHRVTKQLFEACACLVEGQADDEDGAGSEVENLVIKVDSADMRRIGLDVWSQSDRNFLAAFAELWFQRDVEVAGMGVECCGIRIC